MLPLGCYLSTPVFLTLVPIPFVPSWPSVFPFFQFMIQYQTSNTTSAYHRDSIVRLFHVGRRRHHLTEQISDCAFPRGKRRVRQPGSLLPFYERRRNKPATLYRRGLFSRTACINIFLPRQRVARSLHVYRSVPSAFDRADL